MPRSTVDTGDRYQPSTYDVHVRRAAKHFGIDPAQVTEEQRRVGKTLNYWEYYDTILPGNPVEVKIR